MRESNWSSVKNFVRGRATFAVVLHSILPESGRGPLFFLQFAPSGRPITELGQGDCRWPVSTGYRFPPEIIQQARFDVNSQGLIDVVPDLPAHGTAADPLQSEYYEEIHLEKWRAERSPKPAPHGGSSGSAWTLSLPIYRKSAATLRQ